MRRTASFALLALSLAAAPAVAQGPGPMPGPGRGAPPQAAAMLLAHTGELELTDAQVVRLAAIARRAHQRHEGMPAPGTPRPQPSDADAQRMRQQREQAREQSRADLRDALAVLTPEQQARAWELAAARGPGGRGMHGRDGMHGGPDGPGGMRGPGGQGGPGRMRGRPGAPGEMGAPRTPPPGGAEAPPEQPLQQ